MKILADIISAYNSVPYINPCIESILKQKQISNWKIEIRIGIDACPETSAVCSINHYYNPVNAGAYVMRNSLIALCKADAYSIFDADDIAFPEYLFYSLSAINHGAEAVMTAKINTDHILTPLTQARIEAGGAITFTHKVLEAVGGFQPYRCAGDTDFMRRIEMAGFEIFKLNTALYYRRIHKSSLTRRPDTGMGSKYRKQSWATMTEQRHKGIIKIVPKIIKLEKR